MKKIYNIILATVCLAIGATACNSLDLAPTNKFTELNYWTSEAKASSVLSMAYNQMYSAGKMLTDERLSDNFFSTRGDGGDEGLITAGSATSTLGLFASIWSDGYATIKTCHTFLENVDRVPMDDALKTRMKAEARFIRAYTFFRLSNYYGAVPLFDHNITLEESNTIARSSRADVLNFVRTELTSLAADLPNSYSGANIGRINKAAAEMLLARTYLYENDYAQVADICEKIINGDFGTYSLFPDYEDLFLPENEYNGEVILDCGYVLNYRTWNEYYDYIPLSVGGRINVAAPTQELVDEYYMANGLAINAAGSGYNDNNPYVNRDARLTATVCYDGYQWKKADGSVSTINIKPGSSGATVGIDEYQAGGQNATGTGYYMRKYFDPQAPQGVAAGLNIIMMRYADVLLMYAEAMNETDAMTADVWNKTIRPIRERAGFTSNAALDFHNTGKDAIREQIRHERRVELAGEGLRFYDIRRWKTIEKVQNTTLHGAKFANNNTEYIKLAAREFNPERDYLFAVPQAQKDINPNLGQNNKY